MPARIEQRFVRRDLEIGQAKKDDLRSFREAHFHERVAAGFVRDDGVDASSLTDAAR